MHPIQEDAFRHGLETAISQRARKYANAYTLQLRFQNDDTQAINDSENFKTICKAFGLPAPLELVVLPTDPTPSWEIAKEFQKMLTTARQAPGRSLVMLHYAGHGSINQFSRLTFQANATEKKLVRFEEAFLNHVKEDTDFSEDNPDVDVVMIIDSCCSGSAANRALPHQIPRVVEILAACESDKTAFGNKASQTAAVKARTQNRTFSAKLADIVAKQKGKGEPLSFAEIMALVTKDSPVIKPFYELFVGSSSVTLPFPSENPPATSTTPSPESPMNYRAVFSVHISGLLTEEKLKDLIIWIRNLDASLNISLDGVYKTNSVGLVIEAPFHVYAQLKGLPGINLLFENTSGNQLDQLTQANEPVPDLSRLSLSPMKENVKRTFK